MKSFLKKTFILLFVAIFAFSCENSFDSLVDERLENNPVPDESVSGDPGSADFSNYVAIGNSLTAGFMDAALYNDGQQNSLPALIGRQLQSAGAPDTFNQPNINSELGFNTSAEPNPQDDGTILGRYKLDTSIPGPSPTIGGDPISDYSGNASDLNNFGVPGVVVGQLLAAATGGPESEPAFNPFYARFASDPGSSTILGDAISTQPSFFTLWIGSNDVLGYAVSGASNPALLTSQSDFNTQFNAVINQLTNNTSADGVVANIPNVLTVPFFQAVQWNAINLTAEEAQQLDQSFDQSLNPVLDAVAANFPNHTQEDMNARKVTYQEGDNPILVNDPTLDDLEEEFDQLESQGALSQQQREQLVPYEQSRPLTQGELVTLSAGAVLGAEYNPQSQGPTTIGVVIPLGFPNPQNPDLGCTEAQGDECYLTLQEQAEIQTRTAEFNGIIEAAANSSDRLALYDTQAADGAFADIFGADGELGIRISGTLLQPDFSPNGIFSTDGIHPNQRGNAILANEFIRVIEDNFGATIPEVDVLNLPSVQLCAGNCVSQQQQSKQVVGVGNLNYNISLVR